MYRRAKQPRIVWTMYTYMYTLPGYGLTLLDFKCLSVNTGAQSQPCLIIGSDPLNAYCLFHDDRVGLVDSHTLPAKYASTHVSPASTSCLLDIEYDQGSPAPALHWNTAFVLIAINSMHIILPFGRLGSNIIMHLSIAIYNCTGEPNNHGLLGRCIHICIHDLDTGSAPAHNCSRDALLILNDSMYIVCFIMGELESILSQIVQMQYPTGNIYNATWAAH